MHVVGLVIVWAVSLAIIGIGIAYWMRNEKNAAGFGLPVLPAPEARGWWQVKGVRDVASGLVPIAMVFAAPDALGWVLLIEALIPAGDATLVLANHGRRSAAFGIHGVTAAVMIVGAVLLLAS
ncbi:DUF4267 domain-containing protein [Luteipulveratus sp. YIM 133132]|uniref:DUF4267 domain-containing protein n=1 Tax=Luteipulveratus flavus TaxID=3031728 RepID=A0ABT6C7H7_9MICO|nr:MULTISPECIES: DUF4267 domain-containing protein [unclassified Luteipulveratus]MDE9366453.1 DUF4267 domain-containing protein [Luteipulveratus sp. YIM 133132]MDF8264272.1 DUF4267 domain-containing protein [Luteipulveratus sp. YIM 133296]